MAEITAQMVKELRERTGAGVKECKDILEQTNGDIEKAIEELRKRGLRVSDKVAGREAKEGRIEVYVHHGARVAAMVELNCETDFVARTDDFIQLARDIAMQVAAMNPRYLRPEEVPESEISASGLSPDKFYQENVLLKQIFIKDSSQTIEEKIQAAIARIRENIVVRRFVRYEIGG